MEKHIDKEAADDEFAASIDKLIEEYGDDELAVDDVDKPFALSMIENDIDAIAFGMSRVVIGVVATYPHIPYEFFESFVGMKRPNKCHMLRAHGYDGIAELRNQLCRATLLSGATHLFMMDVDMLYPRDTLSMLLASKADVIQGLACRSRSPYDALVMKAVEGKRYTMGTQAPEGSMEGKAVDVDAVGAGGMLIRREVLETLPDPWFRHNEVREDNVPVSEDIYFSVSAKEAGFSVQCHTGVKYGHMLALAGYVTHNGDTLKGAWGTHIQSLG